MKRILLIFVVAACVWLLLFQGTVISAPPTDPSVHKSTNDGLDILLRFVVFVISLRLLAELLHWHFFDRPSVSSRRI